MQRRFLLLRVSKCDAQSIKCDLLLLHNATELRLQIALQLLRTLVLSLQQVDIKCVLDGMYGTNRSQHQN